jgi:hypothetical protein
MLGSKFKQLAGLGSNLLIHVRPNNKFDVIHTSDCCRLMQIFLFGGLDTFLCCSEKLIILTENLSFSNKLK